MPTWMFFIGLEVIVSLVCAVWVVKWMTATPDKYDTMLEKIAENYKRQAAAKQAAAKNES